MSVQESREKVWNLLLEEAAKRGVKKAGLEAATLGRAWEGEISSKISVSLPESVLEDDRHATGSQASTAEKSASVGEVIQPSAEPEQGSPEAETDVSEEAEIPDEIYAELGAALAEDWTAAIEAGEPKMIEFLMKDDGGLWAEVRRTIYGELKEQNLLEADRGEVSAELQEPARQALSDAVEGLWEALNEAGGYEWLLTQEEA
jgi:hypothetical protein